jgi:AcrR family transcriptional regulator
MARLRSPEKRKAILEAAVIEIGAAGLSAPTSRIASRAGVAEGTLFTYFANKDTLLNELYLELKIEVYRRLNAELDANAGLKERSLQIWTSYLDWAIEFPQKRNVSLQLHISNLISSHTRELAAVESKAVAAAISELGQRAAARGLPAEFGSASMSAMQEVAMDMIAKQPEKRLELVTQAFEAFWRAVE